MNEELSQDRPLDWSVLFKELPPTDMKWAQELAKDETVKQNEVRCLRDLLYFRYQLIQIFRSIKEVYSIDESTLQALNDARGLSQEGDGKIADMLASMTMGVEANNLHKDARNQKDLEEVLIATKNLLADFITQGLYQLSGFDNYPITEVIVVMRSLKNRFEFLSDLVDKRAPFLETSLVVSGDSAENNAGINSQ